MYEPTSDSPRRASRRDGLLLPFCLAGCLILSLLIVAGPADAQTRCEDNQTLDQCWKAATKQAAEVQTDATTTELNRTPTGAEADIAGVRSNTRDYLPLLALGGLLGEATRDENDENVLVLDLNFLVPWISDAKNFKLRGLLNTQPTVATPLAEMLPEEDRADRIQELERTLPDTSDIGFSLSYSQELLNWGRGFRNYRNRYAALIQTVNDGLPNPNEDVALGRELTEQVGGLLPMGFAGGDVLALTPNGVSEALAPGCDDGNDLRCSEARRTATKLRQMFETFIDAHLRTHQQLETLYRTQGIDAFADLLDNQPQLIFDLSHHDREDLVGATETVGTFRFEWSKVNLKNAMSKECHEQLEDEAYLTVDRARRSECLEEYSKYVAAHRNAIEKGHRISVNIDYADVDDISVARSVLGLSPEEPATDDGPIVIPGSDRFDLSLGWSRTFQGDGSNPVVFDLVATYERLEESDDTFRHDDRILATLNITRSFGGVEVPFAVVYANHGEFLTDVDEQLSAHVGLRYDLGGLGKSKKTEEP